MESSPCTAPDSECTWEEGWRCPYFPLHSDITSTSGVWNILTTPVQIAGSELWHLALGWHFIPAGTRPASPGVFQMGGVAAPHPWGWGSSGLLLLSADCSCLIDLLSWIIVKHFVKCFFSINWCNHTFFSSFYLFMCLITFIDFWIMNCFAYLGWCIILSIYCWVLLDNILLWIFTSIFLTGINLQFFNVFTWFWHLGAL